MYNRRGHPRAEAIESALSAVAGATHKPELGRESESTEELVALRYRGAAVLVDNEGSASDIET